MPHAWLLRFALLLATSLLVQGDATAQASEALLITFLDVGQGDAVLVRSPEGRTALIDAGRGADLVPTLRDLGVDTIDLLVASHPHADHIGGMVRVIDAIPVRYFMDNGRPHTTQTYRALIETVQRRADIIYLEAVPRTIALGSLELEVLPLPAHETDHNDRSLALVLRHGSFVALLSGDSETGELSWLDSQGVIPDVTLLKAPHHGSNNGFTWPFLEAARPEVVVISVGANGYGHPGAEALAAYATVAGEVYRTDRHGQVTVAGFRDGRFEVTLDGLKAASGASGGAARPDGVLDEPRASLDAPPALSLSVFADAPGNDHQNPNGEYVVLKSGSAEEMVIGGWRLCDAARHCFRFPDGAVLPGGGRVTVYTGSGVSGGVHFFMGSRQAVWNNDGDTATLYDASGRVLARHVYD